MEKQNAKAPAQIFYARHMQQGVARYDDEMILVTEDAIKAMMPSFNGKPVYVYHVDEIDLENTHGYVTDTFYNELDGWVWSKILLTDEVALDAVAKGWAVSNAYIPTEYSNGGTHHNVAYDRKILNGEYTHLAIVDNPRYEDACVMSKDDYKAYCMSKKAQLEELQNSKNDEQPKENFIMNIFKRKKKEEGDVFLEIKNDKGEAESTNISELIREELAEILNAKKNESEKEEEKMNMDAEIEVGNEKMTVKELINRYTKSKKNEADEDEKSNEDDEKENSDDEEKENEADEEKDEKKNSHFDELKNANKAPAQSIKTYMTFEERRELANSKY
jgi:hypothetical protein